MLGDLLYAYKILREVMFMSDVCHSQTAARLFSRQPMV